MRTWRSWTTQFGRGGGGPGVESRPTPSSSVTLPLTIPGIIAGSLLVFIPATGEYVIPDLLGGGNVQMIGRVLFNEFSRNTDWPVAAAVAIVLLFLLVLPILVFQYYPGQIGSRRRDAMYNKRSRFLTIMITLGMAFFYIPMILLVIYSFNHSKLVPVWGGWSTRWYKELFQSEEVWAAVGLSLRIAVVNATFATVLGTFAALAMVRFGRFRGRTLFGGMLVAPLVMPEVITGLSLLVLFISLQQMFGWPAERGFSTITIAHITFSLAYVAVTVQARLTGVGQDLEEAAADLGAKPFKVLTAITIPQLTPALVSGWLLAFTLSLDDLVIASFVTGPGANTLPILIFSRIRLGLRPDINALATIIILIVAVCVAIAALILYRQHRRSLLDQQLAARADA